MPEIRDVVEAALYVDDLDRAEAFYRDVLELPLVGKKPGRHVFFQAGEGLLLLFRPEVSGAGGAVPAHGARGPGHVALGIDVDELDAWRQRLAEHGVEKVDRDGLFDRADLLSVHAPLSEETRGMVDADALARLPDDAVLVNTGRGAVVDVDAVAAALEAGELGAAGLDVLPAEPPAPDHPVLDAERAVVTPHVAWYSEESRRDVAASVAVDVARVLRGEEPASPVDPQVRWA